MKIKDQCIVLSSRKLGERTLLVQCFLMEHGIFSGIVKKNTADKQFCKPYPYGITNIELWKKNESHIPICNFEEDSVSKIPAAYINPKYSLLWTSALELTRSCIGENEPYSFLWKELKKFLESMEKTTKLLKILYNYLRYEINLIKATGFSAHKAEDLIKNIDPALLSHISKDVDDIKTIVKTDKNSCNNEQDLKEKALSHLELKVIRTIREALYEAAKVICLNIIKTKLPLQRQLVPKIFNSL